MNKKYVESWIAALRSGKYKKIKGQLTSDNTGYCCLGVACDIYPDFDWGIFEYTSDLEVAFLPNIVMMFEYNLHKKPPDNLVKSLFPNGTPVFANYAELLAQLNDDLNYSFEEIADFIKLHILTAE